MNALHVDEKGLTLEVQQQLGDGIVRTIAWVPRRCLMKARSWAASSTRCVQPLRSSEVCQGLWGRLRIIGRARQPLSTRPARLAKKSAGGITVYPAAFLREQPASNELLENRPSRYALSARFARAVKWVCSVVLVWQDRKHD